jgi:hypothetical protein
MKAENFCFWLQGFFELNGNTATLSPEQVELVKMHLGLVFKHDPTMAHEAPEKKAVRPFLQKELEELAKKSNNVRGRRPGVLYC